MFPIARRMNAVSAARRPRAGAEPRKRLIAALLSGCRDVNAGAYMTAPWGRHGVIGMHKGMKIKEILIAPGECTSLQRHLFRAEYWWVAEGRGRGTIGRRRFRLTPGRLLYVPLGAVHRLECTGGRALRVIEAQEGRMLAESDVIRLSDKYGRAFVGV